MKLFDMTVLPLGALRKAPWNYKTDDPEMAAKLQANMERNGQLENIVVRQIGGNTYEVVNGNHRYDAMSALGWTHATCLDLGEITVEKAKRIAVELNETKFDSSPQALSEVLVSLVDGFGKGDVLETLPFDSSFLETMTDPSLFMPPPDPPNTPDSASGPPGSGGASSKIDTPFTFTLRFHEKNLVEWMSLLKQLRDAYATDRNEDALLSLVRSFVPTAVESGSGFKKVVGLLPPQVMETFKQVEAHVASRLEEDGQSLIEDPHLRLGQMIEALAAEYIASYGL